MKTKLSLVTLMLLLASVFSGKAQTLDAKYGLDSAKTVLHASLYTELVKQKNYKDALPHWRIVFKDAPKFQKTTYKKGVSIIRYMISKTKNSKYVDTLMMVYDQRIKYFGNDRKYGKGYILGRKGGDLFRYKSKDLTAVKEAYNMMKQAVELQKNIVEAAVLDKCMECAKLLVEKGELQKEEVVDDYLKFMEICDYQIQKYPKKKNNLVAAKSNIENNFFAAGVASCETLGEIFTPKFKANPNDMDLLNKILKLLNRQECEESPLYAMVAEKKYELDPNADAAHNLARMFIKKKDYAKTKDYLGKAIELEENAENKADLYFKMASIYFSETNLQEAKSNALKAISHRPNWGKPYILIGKAYASYSKKYGTSEFEHQSVFWAAVDKFIKAKRVDPECAEEANTLIKTWSQYFPTQEEAFFLTLKNGDKYKIGGWINETTTVRVNH